MVNPWLGMAAVVAIFGLMMAGLRAYRQWRSPDAEALRKLLHVGMGFVTLAFPWVFAATWPVLVLAVTFVVGLSVLKKSAALRRRFGGVIEGVGRVSRGEIYFPLGVGLVFLCSAGDALLFCIPVLILTLADTAAALIGRRYGRHGYAIVAGEKTVEGSVAFFAVAFLSTHIPLLVFTETGRVESLLIGLALGLEVTLLEAVAWDGLDNLFIPLGGFGLLIASRELDVPTLTAHLGIALVLVSVFARLVTGAPRVARRGDGARCADSQVLSKGELIAIAGPSGSGKTTLLNILGLLLRSV